MTSLVECRECGCKCRHCNVVRHDVHLLVEVENLKQKLLERETHIQAMETNILNEVNKFPNGETAAVQEELFTWQDKYKRLYEAHRRIQRVNQSLEDKLLRLVDIGETEKGALTKDVAVLSHKLAEANYTIKKLQDDNERYKNDVLIAIQFLQCKQGNFVSKKLESLPNEVQAKVSNYVGSKKKIEEKKSPPEVRSIKVPIPTFPPTAMVYSVSKSDDEEEMEEAEDKSVDVVSAAIMAKVLEEREKERSAKHCDTCTCANRATNFVGEREYRSAETQTADVKSLCLGCNGDISRSSTAMKLVAAETISKVAPNCDNATLWNGEKSGNVAKVVPDNFFNDNQEHHRLCTHNTNSISSDDRSDNAKSHSKGPRYCSVRLQSGSKNILLDNISSDVSPVLYTHPSDRKLKNEWHNIHVHSGIVHGHKPTTVKSSEGLNSQTGTFSSGDRKSVNVTGHCAMQNQQRVAEWIESNQNNLGNPSSSDNSQSDCSKPDDYVLDIDPVKYAEMESNVKRFLFGESQSSEFIPKKVIVGKE